MSWNVVAEITVDPESATVLEHGWQSWSPTAWYRLTDRPHRPVSDRNRRICYRPETTAPADAFWGEGLLAVAESAQGPTHVFAAPSPDEVPSIRADLHGTRLVITADGPIEHRTFPAGPPEPAPAPPESVPAALDSALAAWADDFAAAAKVGAVRPAPTIWSHWYHYFGNATTADIEENLAATAELDLPIDVVQIDDCYETALGDWLSFTDGFADLPGLLDRILQSGRTPGIWMAPFFAGEKSELFRRSPEWLVKGADGRPMPVAYNWDQQMYALDTTHPDAATWLTETISAFRGWGVGFYKMDFIFAAAVEGHRHEDVTGVAAYRHGLRLIRDAIGPDGYLLGCGAPMLPSVGLVDAVRTSPDTGPNYEPADGDMSQPSQRAAVLTGRARAFTHGRWWAADPDCIIVRPEVERREDWARHIEEYGGLRGSSDRLRDLDPWGLETTRRLLSAPIPEHLVSASAD